MSDLRFAVRQLLKSPAFSFLAIVTLALGIGASTAIFSVVDAVLLRPLPYPSQERLVEISELTETGQPMRVAQPNFDDLEAGTHSFGCLAAYGMGPEAVAGGAEPVRTNVSMVSPDFFRVLGVTPIIGRLISADAKQEGYQVAVVSYGFWQRMLGGRANLAGTTLRFSGHSFAVIGVLPPQTEFPAGVDVWYPSNVNPPNESRTAHNFRVIGRLRAGVSLAAANAEIATLGRALKAQHGSQTDAASFGLTPFRERFVRNIRSVVVVLCGAVGLLLAIAVSNVANLFLVRATARRKEVALRAALGASRGRLARQFIVESLLLTLIGGILGALLAAWSVRLIVGLYHGDLPRVGEIGVSGGVLLFAFGISLLLAVVLGLVPALHTGRTQLQSALQDADRGSSGGSFQTRSRNLLLIGQVALTLILLIGAGLLGRSFQSLLKINPGFRSEHVVAMTVLRAEPEGTDAMRALAQFYHQLLEGIQNLPGVIAVGGVDAIPLNGNGANGTFIEERGGKAATTMQELMREFADLAGSDRAHDADYRAASAGYFAAMGIPLIRGRLFQETDGPDAPHVALVSRSLADRYWPGANVIGKQIQFGNMDNDLHLLTIIGVVGDVHDSGLERSERPTVYTNYFQRPGRTAEFSIVLHSESNVSTSIAAMRHEAQMLDPAMPVKFETLEQIISSSLDSRRFSMVILGVFAGSALLLAMVGLYGTMSYATAQRTTEFGIRMALGAQRSDMLQLVLRQSLTLVSAGIALGIVLAISGTRLLSSLLFGVGATDLQTYSGVTLLLVSAALTACYFPARRASLVDPMVALRNE
jgi:putative ABC transport system permease protein